MTDEPFLEPDEPDPQDDEADADKEPNHVCRNCGDPDCTGLCYTVMGLNTP